MHANRIFRNNDCLCGVTSFLDPALRGRGWELFFTAAACPVSDTARLNDIVQITIHFYHAALRMEKNY
jgi:hypothetical protein